MKQPASAAKAAEPKANRNVKTANKLDTEHAVSKSGISIEDYAVEPTKWAGCRRKDARTSERRWKPPRISYQKTRLPDREQYDYGPSTQRSKKTNLDGVGQTQCSSKKNGDFGAR